MKTSIHTRNSKYCRLWDRYQNCRPPSKQSHSAN